MQFSVDIPVWAYEMIMDRAMATGGAFDDALLQSLDIDPLDPLASTLGWAVTQGVSAGVVAQRAHRSRSSVEQAATRYRRRQA